MSKRNIRMFLTVLSFCYTIAATFITPPFETYEVVVIIISLPVIFYLDKTDR